MFEQRPAAHFDDAMTAVVVDQLTIRDKDVAREAQRWTRGERGPLIEDPGELADADLSEFVREAVRLGTHALSVTGQAHEAQAFQSMLKDVGDKTAASTRKAAELTGTVVRDASDSVVKAAAEAQKAITKADEHSRKEFVEAVAVAKSDLNAEVGRIFGGERPELVERLQPVLDKFGADLDTKVRTGTAELLARTARQFDPADPTSPFARQAADLAARQEQLTQRLEGNHKELTGRIQELATALKLKEATTALAKGTPIKGDSYANGVHALMAEIAAGLGDEYADTSSDVGLVTRSKKGDGLLTVDGGVARVVLEMTDSTRSAWSAYFDEAERNRAAGAALGLVRVAEQNAGRTVRVLGARRIVMAFDPETDEPDLLRTVVLLLRTAAIAAGSRTGGAEVATAEEKIGEALADLGKVDEIKKAAGSIHKSATKIENQCTEVSSGIRRLLDEALAALQGTGHDVVSGAA